MAKYQAACTSQNRASPIRGAEGCIGSRACDSGRHKKKGEGISPRERAFDVEVDGRSVSGIFDCVHVEFDKDGKPTSAKIYYFKTDKGNVDLRERYKDQLDAYIKAAALLLAISPEKVEAERSAVPATTPSPAVSTSAASAATKPVTPVQTAPSSGRPARIDPKAKVYETKDKLPRKISGQALAGEFFVLGEYIEGGTVLYAVEDGGKGFLRQYVVLNRTSGLAPGNYYDLGRRPRVTFSREQPLVFVKKIFPGLYAVQVP